jgi:membrane protein implicated in regulation of membrane protease activity
MKLWSIWLIVSVVLLIVEMLTPGAFFFFCFGLGALVTAGIACFAVPGWVTWMSFAGISTLLVIFARPLVRKFVHVETRASNVDELIGKEAVVLEKIRPHHPGTIKIGGEVWKADSEQEIADGGLVRIVKVDGTRLIVKKKE